MTSPVVEEPGEPATIRFGRFAWAVVVLRRFPRRIALALGLFLAFALLLVAEAVFGLLNRSLSTGGTTNDGTYRHGFFVDDPDLGYRPRAGVVASSRPERDGVPVYDVVYTIDDHGRRVTPTFGAAPPTHVILFFGGSFTFGEGLADDATLPAAMARAAPGIRAVNYGFCGWGPQQMLALAQSAEVGGDLEQLPAVAVYLFMDAHLERAAGSLNVVSGWGRDFPYYRLDGEAGLVRDGSFATGRPLTTWLYQTIAGTETARYFQLQWPPIGRRQVALTARMVVETGRTLAQLQPQLPMVTIIYPGSKHGAGLADALAGSAIHVLDYSDLFDPQAPGMSIPFDGHPSALANRVLAARLVDDLNRRSLLGSR